ncbi:MAG: hypothetical protein KDA91_10435 [Planctomycetaceae bacterium]|nr:hypothetical protein [Planctomycetaceae bacterium]
MNGPAFAVSFRPDEKQVAVAGFDGQIRLFDSESGTLQKTFSSAPILEVSATASR